MNEYLVAYMDNMKNQFIMTERVFEDTPEAAKECIERTGDEIVVIAVSFIRHL